MGWEGWEGRPHPTCRAQTHTRDDVPCELFNGPQALLHHDQAAACRVPGGEELDGAAGQGGGGHGGGGGWFLARGGGGGGDRAGQEHRHQGQETHGCCAVWVL